MYRYKAQKNDSVMEGEGCGQSGLWLNQYEASQCSGCTLWLHGARVVWNPIIITYMSWPSREERT